MRHRPGTPESSVNRSEILQNSSVQLDLLERPLTTYHPDLLLLLMGIAVRTVQFVTLMLHHLELAHPRGHQEDRSPRPLVAYRLVRRSSLKATIRPTLLTSSAKAHQVIRLMVSLEFLEQWRRSALLWTLIRCQAVLEQEFQK